MTLLRKFDRWAGYISKAMAIGASVAAAAIMIMISSSVILRTVRGHGIRGFSEIAAALLVFIVFLGIAYAERTKTHVRMTLITDRLGRRAAGSVRVLAALASLGFVTIMAAAALDRATRAYQTGEYGYGLLTFPLWPVRGVIVLGLGWLILELLRDGTSNLLIAIGREPLDPEVDSLIDSPESDSERSD